MLDSTKLTDLFKLERKKSGRSNSINGELQMWNKNLRLSSFIDLKSNNKGWCENGNVNVNLLAQVTRMRELFMRRMRCVNSRYDLTLVDCHVRAIFVCFQSQSERLDNILEIANLCLVR